ncbi:hypothetical protein [Metabacillus niabensis]|uniref:Lipoprotein n=1 Tax=Metabacillus niabensis TaxID=324854 RepID=A0ABT9Z2I3_9BACI|nr:hypothetical protein [Metabacillus niabensis]MDQ0226468.1 hypothetical protein [Metabacillus niabensis]
MKRIFVLLLAIPIAITLVSCSQKETKAENTISVANLTNREEAILSITSDKSSVFEFQLDNRKYKQLSLWVEKYELGKLVNEEINFMTTEVEGKGTIIFTASQPDDEQNQFEFHIGVESNRSTSSANAVDSLANASPDGVSYSWETNQSISIKNEMVFSSICISKPGAEGMSSLSTEFYQDVDRHIDKLKEYDTVYLLRGEFK